MRASCPTLCIIFWLLPLIVVSLASPTYLANSEVSNDEQEMMPPNQMSAADRLLAILKHFSYDDRNAFLEFLGPERRKALSEILDRDNVNQQLAQKPSRKRSNVMCRFKICNLGRRRRIQTAARSDFSPDNPQFESGDVEHIL